VLDELASLYGAKATFFCIGQNCSRASGDSWRGSSAEGHTVGIIRGIIRADGEHLYRSYLRNVCAQSTPPDHAYFRPPYGSITLHSICALRKRYQVILWDVLSGDYDTADQMDRNA
jgi:peptidoglycan/xylan/chitin deacetylase (PgdA/CDA1 family)